MMNQMDTVLSQHELPGLLPFSQSRLSGLPRSARLALSLLDQLRGGAVIVSLPQHPPLRVGQGPVVAHLQVDDLRVFGDTLARGDIGFGESYMAGDWQCAELPALLALFARNREVLARAVYGKAWSLLFDRVWHRLRANTRSGARRNIEAHYDLGNDFYAGWLDGTMSYSSALFAEPQMELAEAQRHKYRRILQRLDVQPGQTLLEIGCGWGGFAEIAVQEFGARVLGLTLSPAQLQYARERAERGGWAGQVSFELCDYRDVRGLYDHVVSIEMIEAVGERFWPTYFGVLAERLRPGGKALIQAITIDEALFPAYRRGTDFIQRHVFPGGMLPTATIIAEQARRAGMQVEEDFAFGPDYARTLALWRERFHRSGAAAADPRFARLWDFYLAYCEAGFAVGNLDVRQVLLAGR